MSVNNSIIHLHQYLTALIKFETSQLRQHVVEEVLEEFLADSSLDDLDGDYLLLGHCS